MRKIRHASAVPYYGAAAAFALYALIFPMYKPMHYALFFVAGTAVLFVLRAIFPDKVEYIEKPIVTGDENVDTLLREGEVATAEMRRLAASITREAVKQRVLAIADITDKIFKNVADDPDDYKQVRRFADFYLPTTMKLMRTYDSFGKSEVAAENINDTRARIEETFDYIHASYTKQYDALFANQALDIETDIEVLQAMLKKEGLAERDFT